MSSPVSRDDGGFFSAEPKRVRAAPAPPPSAGWSGLLTLQPCPLTVPLLCPPGRRRLQLKRPHQVQRCLAQAHLMQRRPRVDHASGRNKLLSRREGANLQQEVKPYQ